jgi:hypothetical protein
MPTIFANTLAALTPLLAQAATHEKSTSGTGPSPSLQWGIVLFMIILGMLVTLSPPRRTSEVKKPKEE